MPLYSSVTEEPLPQVVHLGAVNYTGTYEQVSVDTCPAWYIEEALKLGITEDAHQMTSWIECRRRITQLGLRVGFQVSWRGSGRHKTWYCRVEGCPFSIVTNKTKNQKVILFTCTDVLINAN